MDQQQTSFDSALSVRANPVQTFGVGRSGSLTQVDVPLCVTMKGSSIIANLSTAGKRARTTITASKTFGKSTEQCQWFGLAFRPPMRLTAGDMLRLTISPVKGPAPLWAVAMNGNDPYTRGTGSWLGHRIDDFAFRTFVGTGRT